MGLPVGRTDDVEPPMLPATQTRSALFDQIDHATARFLGYASASDGRFASANPREGDCVGAGVVTTFFVRAPHRKRLTPEHLDLDAIASLPTF